MEIDPEIASCTERYAEKLTASGGSLKEIKLPSLDSVFRDSEAMWAADVGALLRRHEVECGRAPRDNELEALTRRVLKSVSSISALEFIEAKQRLHDFAGARADALSYFNFIVTPTTAQTAPELGYFDSRTAAFDYDEFGRRSFAFAPFTEIFKIMGWPAASVPVGLSSQGLSIGVQVAAPMMQDDRLLVVCQHLLD